MKKLTDLLKEFLRLAVIGAVTFLLTEGVLAALVDLYAVSIPMQYHYLIVGGLTSFFKSVDRTLHEHSDDGTGMLKQKGLVGF